MAFDPVGTGSVFMWRFRLFLEQCGAKQSFLDEVLLHFSSFAIVHPWHAGVEPPDIRSTLRAQSRSSYKGIDPLF